MSEKIFHFHLECPYGNKSTLVCNLVDGNIKYSFYSGTANSGTPLALSNMQIGYKYHSSLPVDNKNKLTKQEFTDRVRFIINNDSVKRVINEVETEVTFE